MLVYTNSAIYRNMENDYTSMADEIEYDSARPERPKPLAIGDKKGKLMLLYRFYVNRKDWWSCVCDCGVKKDIRGDSIRAGQAKSCGCAQHETVGRPNQMSSRIPRGEIRFHIRAYNGNPTKPGGGRTQRAVEFCAVSVAGAKPGEYHLSTCGSYPVIGGGVPGMMIKGMHTLKSCGLIGPQDGLTIPQWAEKYGVAYTSIMTAGESHIRGEYERMQYEQKFFFKGKWLDYGDGK